VMEKKSLFFNRRILVYVGSSRQKGVKVDN